MGLGDEVDSRHRSPGAATCPACLDRLVGGQGGDLVCGEVGGGSVGLSSEMGNCWRVLNREV